MNKRVMILAMASMLILAIGVSGAAAEYLVGLTHGTDKHRPEWSFDAQSTYHISAAQNEWEPFQVFIWDDSGVENVDVSVTEFTGPGDPIERVELYRVHYVHVDEDKVSQKPMVSEHAGWWPDGLVPFVDHFVYETRDGAPFDVQAEFTQAVFVDVYIPEDQTPGEYSATVTVTADGRATWTGTIYLTVWDFALPNGLSIQSQYQYSRSICTYHQEHGNATDCAPIHERYFEEYALHRMSPYNWLTGNPPTVYNPETKSLEVDWTQWDADHGPYLDGDFFKPGYEFQTINIPRSFGNVPEGLTQDEWNIMNWAAWAEHFKQKGWIEKAWCYLPDEPTPDEYPALRATAANIHTADPDLQPFVTEQYESELGEDIDIWCPDEPMFSDSLPWLPRPEKYEELREEGKKTWWYNCVSATIGFDYANHMVDQESTYMRAWLWLTRRYGFTGILFWRIQYLWDRQDVWENMYAEKFYCQGDGTLYYPGTPDKIGGETDIPIPSLRIKYLREAMEDYEYFHILDEMGEEQWVDDVTRTVAPKTFQWEHDWAKLLDWRRKVAEKILGTLDEVAPAPPTGLSAEGQVESIEVSWTAPTDADLAGYEVWYAIQSGDEYFGGSLGVDAASAVLVGLMPGREHTIWIQSFDTNGNHSVDSASVTATPQADETADDDDTDDDKNSSQNAVRLESKSSDDKKNADDDEVNYGGCGW